MSCLLDDRLHAIREPFDRIPVVDIGPLLDGSDKAGVAREIRWALTHVGFLYIRNHGVAAGLVDAVFDETRAFFDLPLEEKMALHIRHSGRALRGYIELFGENTDPANTKDLKEAFDIGPERPGDPRPFFGANPWPPSRPRLGEVVGGYHDRMRALSMALLRGVALSLDLDEGYFDALMRDPISIQRLQHYPPQTGRIDPSVIGIGAHTDYGSLTVLAQDAIGGLQVMNRDGRWIEAPPIDGTFIVNIGDLIQRLTNDLYLANLHRVVNTSGRERYSIPFFIDADYDARLAPVATCVAPDNPCRYDPIVCGDHKFARFVASFPHLAA